MELSWSTFLMEIVNFLILIWILKRFLYAPILDLIARRRAGIEKSLADAKALNDSAEKLQHRFEGRLASWEQERQQARAELSQEIEEARNRKMAELQDALAQEREKARVADARRQSDVARRVEEAAIAQSARFAARLLGEAAGPGLEKRLVDMVISQLSGLSAERTALLRKNWGTSPQAIIVASAFTLPDEQRRRLEQVLADKTGLRVPVQFEPDPELMAGLRINVGAWVLGANLRDELEGFTKLTHAD